MFGLRNHMALALSLLLVASNAPAEVIAVDDYSGYQIAADALGEVPQRFDTHEDGRSLRASRRLVGVAARSPSRTQYGRQRTNQVFPKSNDHSQRLRRIARGPV